MVKRKNKKSGKNKSDISCRIRGNRKMRQRFPRQSRESKCFYHQKTNSTYVLIQYPTKVGFFIFKKVLTNTAKRATIPGWRAGRRRDVQRLVDILWITRHVSRRHHFYTSLLHFGADAIDLTLHFCTLAQGAPEKLNENHSHLEKLYTKNIYKK